MLQLLWAGYKESFHLKLAASFYPRPCRGPECIAGGRRHRASRAQGQLPCRQGSCRSSSVQTLIRTLPGLSGSASELPCHCGLAGWSLGCAWHWSLSPGLIQPWRAAQHPGSFLLRSGLPLAILLHWAPSQLTWRSSQPSRRPDGAGRLLWS